MAEVDLGKHNIEDYECAVEDGEADNDGHEPMFSYLSKHVTLLETLSLFKGIQIKQTERIPVPSLGALVLSPRKKVGPEPVTARGQLLWWWWNFVPDLSQLRQACGAC